MGWIESLLVLAYWAATVAVLLPAEEVRRAEKRRIFLAASRTPKGFELALLRGGTAAVEDVALGRLIVGGHARVSRECQVTVVAGVTRPRNAIDHAVLAGIKRSRSWYDSAPEREIALLTRRLVDDGLLFVPSVWEPVRGVLTTLSWIMAAGAAGAVAGGILGEWVTAAVLAASVVATGVAREAVHRALHRPRQPTTAGHRALSKATPSTAPDDRVALGGLTAHPDPAVSEPFQRQHQEYLARKRETTHQRDSSGGVGLGGGCGSGCGGGGCGL